MPVHAPQITEFDFAPLALGAAASGRLNAGDIVFVPSEDAIGIVSNNLVYAVTMSGASCFYMAVGDWSDCGDSIEIADQLARLHGLTLRPNIEQIAAPLR